MVVTSVAEHTKDLTIFTATYNRARLLPRLFDSIHKQVSSAERVEWLVVDDGSNDDTPDVLAEFARLRPELVRSVRTENGGKHRAINLAAEMASGRWIMIMDSDDVFRENAIADMLDAIIRVDGSPTVGTIRGLQSFSQLSVSHSFRIKNNPCKYTEWIASQPKFDTAEIFRKEALRLHRFPEFAGETFMAEGWLYHRLDKNYDVFFVNREWVDCFYQETGLSALSRQNRARCPKSAMAVYSEMLDSSLSFRVRLRTNTNWWRYLFHAGGKQVCLPKSGKPSALFAPLGWLLYHQDKWLLR